MGTENIKIDFDGLFNMILKEESEERKNTLRNSKQSELEVVNRKSADVLSAVTKEEDLRQVLFGTKKGLINELAAAVDEVYEDEPEEKQDTIKRKPVWHDSDDEKYHVGDVIKEHKRTKFINEHHGQKSYNEFLRNKYSQIVSHPKWADLDREIGSDSDDELLKTVGHLSRCSTELLPATNISAKRVKDLNRQTNVKAPITNIQFHPTSTAALVADYSGIATIYAIDGKRNEKLHNVKFQNFQIGCARILRSGTEALFGSNRNYFYSYDLLKAEETRIVLPKGICNMKYFELSPCEKYFAVAGRFGEMYLMDLRSKELIHTYKQPYPCVSLQFSNDSRKILTHSSGPEVNVFDIRKERIEHTFLDDGCIMGKAISISPDGKLLATGSEEGVVNIYNYDNVFSSQSPRPLKIFYNVKTSISTVKFNHSSQILGITSNAVPSAVKLIHFPSGTVFVNFPGLGKGKDLGRVGLLDFSPNSGFMALGNKTNVSLFRLNHYNNY